MDVAPPPKKPILSKQARYERRKGAISADVGELPDCSDPERVEKYRYDLHSFLVDCFPNSTGLKPFSDDQETAIRNLEQAILKGGKLAQALPRGFAKTSIAVRAAIWAILYGHRRFVAIYCANTPAAEQIVESMKTELEGNPILYALYPLAIGPIRALEGKPQACKSQTFGGELTKIAWRADKVVMPTVAGSVCCGSVLAAKSVTSARGAQHTTTEGEVLRPDFIILDDPQTDDDAANPATVSKIVRRIKRGALRGGGHSKGVAAVANVTVIEEDDVAEYFLNDPSWMAVRFKMLRTLPDKLEDMWLGKYRELRHSFDKANPKSKERALKKSLKFYKENREEMDAGADAVWEWCYAWADPEACEISAIQHAMNILIDEGEDVFYHECQNETKTEEDDTERLTWRMVASKAIENPRFMLAPDTSVVTAQIDIHDKILSYGVAGFSNSFAGHVADYGTYPPQNTREFLFRKARKTLQDVGPPGADLHGQIYFGITQILDLLFERVWLKPDGTEMKIGRVAIDAGYESKPVYLVQQNHQLGALIVPTKGKHIGAGDRKISEWRVPDGAMRGEEWIYTRSSKRANLLCTFDANYWKKRITESLAAPKGNQHGLTLYQGDEKHHKMFSEHCTAEKIRRERSDNDVVDVFKLPPHKPDNHFWDFLTGAFVTASMMGIKREKLTRRTKKKRSKKGRVRYVNI